MEAPAIVSLYAPSPTKILKDEWNGSVSLKDYESHIQAGNAMRIQFSKLVTRYTVGLPKCHITLSLDDTSNFKNGLGNSRIITLENTKHHDGIDGMHVSDVDWPMMGAMKSLKSTPFAMPNVAKIVVTGKYPCQKILTCTPRGGFLKIMHCL